VLSELLLEESADINPPGRNYGTGFARRLLVKRKQKKKENPPNTVHTNLI
jgi:hypothetical protein